VNFQKEERYTTGVFVLCFVAAWFLIIPANIWLCRHDMAQTRFFVLASVLAAIPIMVVVAYYFHRIVGQTLRCIAGDSDAEVQLRNLPVLAQQFLFVSNTVPFVLAIAIMWLRGMMLYYRAIFAVFFVIIFAFWLGSLAAILIARRLLTRFSFVFKVNDRTEQAKVLVETMPEGF
jgi:hypothetical protein